MLEELKKVDVSMLDALSELKRERDTLRLRLARLSDSGGQVNETVLKRVRSDYESRLGSIQQKADDLKSQARASYFTLKPLRERSQQLSESQRFDEEEVKLRHQLGEFNDEEFRGRVAKLDDRRKANENGLSEISELVARFVGAFDSPEDLESASVASPAPPAPPEPAVSPEDEDHTWITPPEPPPAPAPPPPPPAAAAPEVAAPPEAESSREASQPATAEVSLVAKSATAPLANERTPEKPAHGARLHALDTDIEPSDFSLEALTFIGRTPENQIRIYKPAVSRRHAQIAHSDDGWMLRDLSSENGTYVNGQRVTERLLVDGDRVQFGTSRFVFKSA